MKDEEEVTQWVKGYISIDGREERIEGVERRLIDGRKRTKLMAEKRIKLTEKEETVRRVNCWLREVKINEPE